MSVTAADFYSFAVRIAEAGSTEIEFRNAASRTYYAAFHSCLPRFSDEKDGVDPRIRHADFCQWLKGHAASSPRRQLGFALDYLRQQRNVADYAIDRPFRKADTHTVFSAYGNVLKFLELAAPTS